MYAIASLSQSFTQMSLQGQEQEEVHDRCPVYLHTLSGVPRRTNVNLVYLVCLLMW